MLMNSVKIHHYDVDDDINVYNNLSYQMGYKCIYKARNISSTYQTLLFLVSVD